MDATVRRRDGASQGAPDEPSGTVADDGQQFLSGESTSYAEERRARRRRGRLVRFGIFIPVWMVAAVPLAREIIDGGSSANVVFVYLAVGAASLGIAALIRGAYVLLTKRPFWSPWLFPIAAVLAIVGYSFQTAGEEEEPVAVAAAEAKLPGA